MSIRDLFDPNRQIDRRIEKVIQYDAIDPEALKREIGEYVVTDNMVRSFDKLLDAIDIGMQEGSIEIGVWVSGFYGSGKSSLTKYLGFALDESFRIDGKPFLVWFQDRMTSTALKARVATVASRHKPAVLMLDLASEQLAGATMAEISTVLYTKVMQWAGYSRDRKVAHLELMLERDGKLEAFEAEIEKLVPGTTWKQAKNQPLVANQLASRLASKMYPEIYTDEKSFQDQRLDEMLKIDDQARELIDLVRRRSGRQNVIFVVDEVGQYVAARHSLILNLDGLAKNFKQVGAGRVWLIATAQQTLTQDDPRAQLNTPQLFKLKDRFPIQIDLEASDIREICHQRLLGKSAAGQGALGALFDKHGPQLRFATQLHNTRYYKRELDKGAFVDLYPFLPQHFDILLELLGRLAKSLGGVGLRSAIKIVQDVLIGEDSGAPLAGQPVGTLATAVHFYDTLRHDVRKSYAHVVEGVERATRSFGADSAAARVAKTIAILQVLEDFPVGRENVAALLHRSADAPSELPEVEKAVASLVDEEAVPIAEIDGSLRFMSEAVSELEKERRDLVPVRAERSRILNDLLRDLFTPLPRASLEGTRNVQCAVETEGVAGPTPIAGEKEEIRMRVELVPEAELESRRKACTAESTHPIQRSTIWLLGVEPASLSLQIEEIHRCEQIFNQYRNRTVEHEVGDYLTGQQQRAQSLRGEVSAKIERGLVQGAFVFHGRPQAVTTLAVGLEEAARKALGDAAKEVFEKYAEAPVQAESGLTERFLKTGRLDQIESRNDPLGLVGSNGQVNTGHAALKSVLDHLNQTGREEGRTLLDRFSRAPYGWSKDTLRYLVAALLVGGEAKLRVSGEDITVRGHTATDALKSNTAFNRVGVAPREERTDPESLLRAADRLLEITGEQVVPLEDEVSKVASRFFPDRQREYAHLASELRNLGLPGEECAERIQDGISEILKGDASDAAARLGPESCQLYEDLLWARHVAKALEGDLPKSVRQANRLLAEIPKLPDVGPLGDLRRTSETVCEAVAAILAREDFYAHSADLQTRRSELDRLVETAATALANEYEAFLETEKQRLESRPEWQAIGGEDQDRLAGRLDALRIEIESTLDGIRACLGARYTFQQAAAAVERELQELARERERPAEPAGGDGNAPAEDALIVDDLVFPLELRSPSDLDALVGRLEELRASFARYRRIVLGPGAD